MRYILFVLIFLFGSVLFAQNTPVLKSLKKKSSHSLRVRVVEGLANPNQSGPVVVEVVEVYKSKTIHVGDRIALKMQPFSILDDSAKVNHLEKGNELIVFLNKETPKSYTKNSQPFSYFSLYDDWSGWLFFNEILGEFLKMK